MSQLVGNLNVVLISEMSLQFNSQFMWS